MNFAKIKTHDIANGPGVRVSLFVSGCTHRCPGCFNAEAWDFGFGEPFGNKTEEKILAAMSPEYISGFSLLGGEPLEPENRMVLAPLLETIKKTYPQKSIWCYTGFDFDADLKNNPDIWVKRMLACIDILIDGRYIEKKKDLNLRFRGSSNQKIIDIKATLKSGETVLCNKIKG